MPRAIIQGSGFLWFRPLGCGGSVSFLSGPLLCWTGGPVPGQRCSSLLRWKSNESHVAGFKPGFRQVARVWFLRRSPGNVTNERLVPFKPGPVPPGPARADRHSKPDISCPPPSASAFPPVAAAGLRTRVTSISGFTLITVTDGGTLPPVAGTPLCSEQRSQADAALRLPKHEGGSKALS